MVVLICICLVANDVEQLSRCLFAICRSSSVKCLQLSSACFPIGLLGFLLLYFESSLYILDTIHLSDMWFANVISQSVVCLHCLHMVFC